MSLPYFEIFSSSSLPVDGNCLPSSSQMLPGRTEATFYLCKSQPFPQASNDLTNAGCEPRVHPRALMGEEGQVWARLLAPLPAAISHATSFSGKLQETALGLCLKREAVIQG